MVTTCKSMSDVLAILALFPKLVGVVLAAALGGILSCCVYCDLGSKYVIKLCR